ncbi:MAG TPA: YcxB family protein [Terracidiphilus sp.]|jgi:uncharacterized membrane protein
MQMTYRVSEADYRRAWKLRVGGSFGNRTIKIVMFWVFMLVCLMMLWAVVQRTNHPRTQSSSAAVTEQSMDESPVPAQNEGLSAHALLVNVGPFVLIALIWIFMLFQMGPRRMRRQYLKDPAMQGTYTIDVTPEALAVENTAGVSSRMQWSLFDYWQEGKRVIVLVNKSGTYFIINAAGLAETQQGELRGLLLSVLPKK